MVRPGSCDQFCIVLWPKDAFPKDKGVLTDADVSTLLRMNLTGIGFIVLLQSIVFILWLLLDGVPGFTLYDGASSLTFNAFSHGMFWRALAVIPLILGGWCVCFGITYVPDEGRAERGVAPVLRTAKLYGFVLVLDAIAAILHLAMTANEHAHCTSTLCTQNTWGLIVLYPILLLTAFFDLWQFVRVLVYQNHLELAIGFDRIDMSVTSGSAETKPSAPALSDLQVRIAASPALAARLAAFKIK